MIDRLLFSSVHFVQKSILFNESDKMSFDFLLHFGLTFFHGILVVLLNVLVFLEKLSDLLWSFPLCLFVESLQIRILFYQMRMVFKCVHYHMKQSDCTACVFGVLSHVKQIRRYFVVLQVLSLLLKKGCLLFVDFVQKDDS